LANFFKTLLIPFFFLSKIPQKTDRKQKATCIKLQGKLTLSFKIHYPDSC